MISSPLLCSIETKSKKHLHQQFMLLGCTLWVFMCILVGSLAVYTIKAYHYIFLQPRFPLFEFLPYHVQLTLANGENWVSISAYSVTYKQNMITADESFCHYTDNLWVIKRFYNFHIDWKIWLSFLLFDSKLDLYSNVIIYKEKCEKQLAKTENCKSLFWALSAFQSHRAFFFY